MGTTVYIVDDDANLRNMLVDQVASIGMRARAFASASEFLAAYDGQEPSVVVTDLRMPGMGGIELQSALRDRGAPVSLIVFTGFADVSTAVRVMKAGGIDVVEKSRSPQELLDAIQKAAADANHRQAELSRSSQIKEKLDSLTPRERDVLQLVVKGLPNKLIASELGISINTVEVHRGRVMRKMGADSVADLVRMTMGSVDAA